MRLLVLPLALLVASAAGALPPSSATAAAPWDSGEPFAANPADVARAAAALPAPSDAHVEMLLEEMHLTFEASGRETNRFRRVFRVLSAEGLRYWGMVEVPYSPWYEERPRVRARVVTAEGVVHTLDPATLIDSGSDRMSAPDVAHDNRQLRGPLPGVAVGSVVELEVLQPLKASLFDTGTSGMYPLDVEGRAQRRVRVVVDAPRSLPLRAEVRGGALKPRRVERAGRVQLTWEAGPLPARKAEEPFLLPDAQRGMTLLYSTGKDWSTLAQRYHQVVEEQLRGTSVARQAAEAAGAAKGRQEVTAAVMAWVHAHVRYTGLHAGAAAVVPRPPEETLTRGFGDCKDLATLAVAMLRARGVPANVALLRVNGPDVAEEFPGLGRFDHAIVQVPGSPTLWVDATDPHTPVGSLNLGVQGRRALVAAPGTRALQRLPEAPSQANRLRVTRTLHLAEDGAARVREETEVTGSIAAGYRSYLGATPADAVREGFVSYAKSSLREAKLEGTHVVHGLQALDQPLRLVLEVSGSKLAETDAARAVVRLSPYPVVTRMPDFMLTESKKPEAGAEDEEEEDAESDGSAARVADLLLPETHVYELVYRVVPPEGYRVTELPPARKLPLGPALLEWRFEQAGPEVSAHIRFDAVKRHYTAAEVEAFRAAVVAMGNESAPWLTLERVTVALLEEGKGREALAHLRSAVQRHPREALHHLHLADALLQLGMGEDARAEAREAVKLEPQNARAHLTLARALSADALGRPFRKGFDAAGAEAALRKARALAPKDPEARLELARLLTRGKDGTLHGPGARWADAAAEYRALAKDLDTHEHDDALLEVLWNSEQLRDYLALAGSEGKVQRLRSPEALAARAAVEGAPAALKAVAQLETQERRQALAAAAIRLMGLRRYTEGVALLQEAARGDAPAQLQGQLAMLRKVKRVELSQLRLDDAGDVVRRLSLAAADPEASNVRKLFSRAVLAEEEHPEQSFMRALRATTHTLKKQAPGMSVRALTEMGFALSELQQEGDKARGLRVRTLIPGVAPGNAQSLFLVWEAGAWKVRSSSIALGQLGAEALARAEAGDVAGARLWLDWAREELPTHVAEDRPMARFARLWTRGAAPTDAAVVKAAAASLAVYGSTPQASIKLLEAARSAVKDEGEQRLLDRDLIFAYRTQRDWAALERTAGRVLATRPDDEVAFETRVAALLQLNRPDEVTRLAGERLARLPEDPYARSALANAAEKRGDLGEHQRQLRLLVAAGKAQSGHYNNLAWYALFGSEGASAQAVEEAQHAATMTNWTQPAVLNTVAAVYANAGKPGEAHNLLLKYLPDEADAELAPSDWYVHGRVAEEYGLLATARAAYAKVKSKTPYSGSADVLAQLRLRRLDTASAPATAAPASP